MKPEDVPTEWVEKAAQALGHEYSDAAICRHTAEDVRSALAAVLPEIQAQALEDAADVLASVPDYTRSDYDKGRVDQRHDDEIALRIRAARLAATTEGPK